MSPFHSVFRLSPSSAAPLYLLVICSQQIVLLFLSLYLSVFFDESRDLLSCLTVWACLRVCSPSPPPPLPSLLACRPVWQCYPATPVPRLQKPCLQLLRECQPVRAFPLVGRTHCHTATLSLLAKFLSCFALLSFFLFFLFSFSHSASFMDLFSAGNTLFVSSHCTLVQVPSMAPFFPSSFFVILVDFHELSCHFLLFSHWPATHTHTHPHTGIHIQSLTLVGLQSDPGRFCCYMHVLACHRCKKCSQECKLCWV